MKIISFDIGIKNMAYCILSTSSEPGSQTLVINDWNVLNLINEDPTAVHECTYIIPPKTKKGEPKQCCKKSKYSKNDAFFCDKHAKSVDRFLLPTKQTTTAYLKKQKIDDLIKLGNSLFLFSNIENLAHKKKAELFEIIDNFYKERCLEPIITKKAKNANDIDLIQIGKSMKQMLNAVPHIDEITHVVIENQISQIANRMKTIQGMLAQYFIMKNENIEIDFVSSANKLKQFKDIPTANIPRELVPTDGRTNPNYKEHKRDGVFYCDKIIKANHTLAAWQDTLNTKKKDDLADCFLQGIWYLKHNNIILYAEDLKINIVYLS